MPSPVFIGHDPKARMFKPHPDSNSEPVILEPDELEALRLVDLEGLPQEETGEKRGSQEEQNGDCFNQQSVRRH